MEGGWDGVVKCDTSSQITNAPPATSPSPPPRYPASFLLPVSIGLSSSLLVSLINISALSRKLVGTHVNCQGRQSTMYECLCCENYFYDQDECDDHMAHYDHWIECETCPRTFRSQSACNQHMNTLDHRAPVFPCQSCDREFRSENASIQHMNAVGHWKPRFVCQKCPEKFYNQDAADKHMDMLEHYRAYCRPCDRHFQNENNLRVVCYD